MIEDNKEVGEKTAEEIMWIMTEFIERNINEEMIEPIKGVCEKYNKEIKGHYLKTPTTFSTVQYMRGIE